MPSGKPVWPEYWRLEDEAEKLQECKWNAQYMQDPTSDEGALIKRMVARMGTRTHAGVRSHYQSMIQRI